jgi:hypothetical protein
VSDADIFIEELISRMVIVPNDGKRPMSIARVAAHSVVAALGIPASTLAALRAGTHVVVPREPTEAMLDAACVREAGFYTKSPTADFLGGWRRALAAAQPRRDEGNG